MLLLLLLLLHPLMLLLLLLLLLVASQVDIARHMGQSLNVIHLVEAFEDDVSVWGAPGVFTET